MANQSLYNAFSQFWQNIVTYIDNYGTQALKQVNDKFDAYTEAIVQEFNNVSKRLEQKVSKESGKGLSTNDYTSAEKTKLGNIAAGAEVNQNAFANVKAGTATIAADAKQDTFEIAAGTGILVAGDATDDKVTITNSGVRSISTGATNGTISVNTNGSSAEVAVKGLGSAAYKATSAFDSAGTAQSKADAALASAKSYTDNAISGLINGAPTTLDTLGEIATAMSNNGDVVSALNEAIGKKSNTGHTHSVSHTPAGTVSKPSFTGSAVTSGEASATTTVYSITAVGTLPTLSASVTNKCLNLTFGAGTLPTKGTGVSVPTGSHTHSVTAAGSVSQPTFTGTAATITSGADS